MLYAVFGTHGIKQLAPRFSALKRTSPSAGALHPIEAYVLSLDVEAVACGLYHYETRSHTLARIEALSHAEAVDLAYRFSAGQTYFANAHAIVIHVARFDRMFWKYARHGKAYKAVLMASAHLSQSFYLTATHGGLGAFYTTAINDVDIAGRLRLPQVREAAIGMNGLGLAAPYDDLSFEPDAYLPTQQA
jgi:SagB-type dehydrogenase family enzyme